MSQPAATMRTASKISRAPGPATHTGADAPADASSSTAHLPKHTAESPTIVNALDRAPGTSIVAGRSVHDDSPDASRLTLVFTAMNPATGAALDQKYACATDSQIQLACERAWEAHHAIRDMPAPVARAELLDCIASKISLLGDDLPSIAAEETGFSTARTRTERDRVIISLRQLAAHVRAGAWHNAIIETPDNAHTPIAKPDMRRMQRAIGPVMAIGPGNSPIELGSAGLDTASAIAAGCPVVYKAHPSHPGTDELAGWAIASAIEELDLHPGTFSLLHAGGRDRDAVGHTLAQNPCIRGIVGSCSHDAADVISALAHKRNDGTRVLLTVGTANPMIALADALARDTEAIARTIAEAALLFGGQSCHKPSIVVGVSSYGFEELTALLVDKLKDAEQHVVLSAHVRDRFNSHIQALGSIDHVEMRSGGHDAASTQDRSTKTSAELSPITVSPALLRTDAKTFQRHPKMYLELFGPAVLLVSAANEQELIATAASFQGSLNTTIWAQPSDAHCAKKLMPIIEQRTGRIVCNTSPMHIEDCPALVLGGPAPAQLAGHAGWSSRGVDAIARFTRPICLEGLAESLVPDELHMDNPLGVIQQVDARSATG